jgi:hypothetical protein
MLTEIFSFSLQTPLVIVPGAILQYPLRLYQYFDVVVHTLSFISSLLVLIIIIN